MNTLSSSSASCHRLHSWLPGLQSSAANARPPVMWHGTSSNHFSYASTRNVPRTPTIGPLWLRRSSVAVARFIGKRRSSTGRRPIGVLTHLGAPDFGLGTSSGQTSQGRRRVSAAAAGRISSHGRVDGVSIVWRGARRPSGPVLRAQERKHDKLRGRRDAFSGAFLRASVDCPVARSHVRRRRTLPGEFPPTVACLAPLRRVCVEPLSVQLQSFLSPDRFFVMILELLLSFREFFPFVASGARIFFSEGARI